MYYGIPRSVVEVFVKLCEGCQKKKAQHHQAPLKPIISITFFQDFKLVLHKSWKFHALAS